MGKKKTTGQPQQHATKSFTELVGEANRNALKPYIHEVFNNMANDLSRRIFRQQANIQTRVMALEEILINKFSVTRSDIENAVADVEDDATGYRTAARPATPGDLVRLTIRTKAKTESEFGNQQRRQVTNLMNLGLPEGAMLSLGSKEVESALVGMSATDVKHVTLEDDFKVELTVERVSEKIPPPAPAQTTEAAPATTDAGATNENQNA